MGVQAEKSARTKEEIVSAFWRLYKTKPINKIKAKDVADVSGYSRSTLYYYFEDVYMILEYIETTILQQWEKLLTQTFMEQQNILNCDLNLSSVLMRVMPFYEKNNEYIAVLLSPSGDPQFQQKVKDTLREKIFSTLEIPTDAIEPVLLFEGISSYILAVLVKCYQEEISPEVPAGMMKKEIISNLFNMVLSYSMNPQIKQCKECNALN